MSYRGNIPRFYRFVALTEARQALAFFGRHLRPET
jgi:hypothetical protein